jgi:PAS domain S-box-containing protein
VSKKNKIIIFFILLVINFSAIKAQTYRDSLRNELMSKLESGDTSVATFKLSQKLFDESIKNAPSQAIEYAALCKQIAEKTKDSILIARSKLMLGQSYLNQKNYFMATKAFFDSYSIFIHKNSKKDIAKTLLLWAKVYSEQNNFEIAKPKIIKARQLYRQAGDSIGVAETFILNGNGYLYDDDDTAIIFFNKALDIFSSLKDNYNSALTFNLLAKAHLDNEKPEMSVDYLLRSISIFKQMHKNIDLADTYVILGDVFSYTSEYKKAAEYYNKAISTYKKYSLSKKLAETYYKLAQIFFVKGDYQQAIKYSNIVETKAFVINDFKLKKDALKIIRDTYIKQNKTKKALEYSLKYTQALIDYYEDKSLKNFSSFEMNIETSQFDKEIELLKVKSDKEKLQLAEVQYKRNRFYTGILLFLLFLFVIFIYYRFRERKKTALSLEKANKKLKNEIEERKKAERTAHSNEQRYKLLFSQSPIGILQFTENMEVTELNERFAEIFHIKKEEIIEKQLDRIFDRNTVKKIADLLYNSKDEVIKLQTDIPTKEEVVSVAITIKKYNIWDKNEEIAGGIVIVEDLTEHKKTERFYKRNILSKQKLINHLPDDIILIDKNEKIQECHFPNLPNKELMVSHLQDIFKEETLSIFRANISKVEGTKSITQFFFSDREKNYLVRILDLEDNYLIIISQFFGEVHHAGELESSQKNIDISKDLYLKNIKEDIDKELLPIYQNIQRGLSFIMIKNFAEKIIELGKKHDNALIIDYGEKLLESVTSFNVMQVNEQLEKFPSFISQFLDFGIKI